MGDSSKKMDFQKEITLHNNAVYFEKQPFWIQKAAFS